MASKVLPTHSVSRYVWWYACRYVCRIRMLSRGLHGLTVCLFYTGTYWTIMWEGVIIVIIIGLFRSTAWRRPLPLTSNRFCPALPVKTINIFGVVACLNSVNLSLTFRPLKLASCNQDYTCSKARFTGSFQMGHWMAQKYGSERTLAAVRKVSSLDAHSSRVLSNSSLTFSIICLHRSSRNC